MINSFYRKLSAFITLAAAAMSPASAGILINEVMPCNIGTHINDLYNYAGWVEVVNTGSLSVNLNGCSFNYTPTGSDTTYVAKIDYKCNIEAGEYKLFYFDEIEGTECHFGFKMDADGGTMTLMNDAGNVLSKITVPDMCTYISYGSDGETTGYMLPTPGAANSTAYAAASLSALQKSSQCATPTFGTAPGAFEDETSATTTLATTTTGAKIYYTTNGSIPTDKNGKLYSSAISMKSNTVIRARAYADGKLPSNIVTGSYIFKDQKHSYCGGFTTPIISITTDSVHLYSKDQGICVTGTNGIEGTSSCIGEKANFNQDWKRPVNLEFIKDGKSVFSQEAEASVSGGCSRQESYKVKSFKISASKKCGSGYNKMKYAFFDDRDIKKYKSLLIRNGGNDYSGIRFRDGFMQSLIHNQDIDYQSYRPVAYYIDGVYQGFMELRERINKDYVWSHYGLDDDEIDFLETSSNTGFVATAGDMDAYNNLIATAKSDPTADDYFKNMNQLMDIDEYLNYMVYENFVVNTDWPSNNMKLWRNKDNGRFRWVLFDSDFGFGMYGSAAPNYTTYTTDMILFSQGQGTIKNWGNATDKGTYYNFDSDSEWKTILFSQLMKNPEFKLRYLTKSLMTLKTTYSTERIKAIWDSVSADAYGEYCASHDPNQYWTQKYDEDDEVSGILEFAEKRPNYVLQYLAADYGGELVNLNINSAETDAKFVINGEPWNSNEFSNKYVSNNNLTVTPIAPAGKVFDHWEVAGSTGTTLLNSSSKWRYFYDGTQPAKDWNTTKYDDATWSEGNGKFGYSSSTSSAYDTPLDYGTSSSEKYITAYFRTDFTLDDLDLYESVTADLTYDDGVVVYVNGKEVTRLNMAADTTIDNGSLATTYVNDETTTFKIDKKYLVAGQNIIAVEVHQNSATSSDMTFQLNLTAASTASTSTSKTKKFDMVVSSDLTLTAVFKSSTDNQYPLYINEVCASNHSEGGYADEFGNYGDWIEIYNVGTKDVDVAGLYLTDNASKPTKFMFAYNNESATTIPAGGRIMVWADDDTLRGTLHTNFKLGATVDGPVILSYLNADGTNTVVDSIQYKGGLSANYTSGRATDGDTEWVTFVPCESCKESDYHFAPTPNEENGITKCPETSVTSIDAATAQIVVYPNPVYSELHIVSTQAANINVYDNSGRMIVDRDIVTGDNTLNVSNLSKGIYVLKCHNNNNVTILRFIKQ